MVAAVAAHAGAPHSDKLPIGRALDSIPLM